MFNIYSRYSILCKKNNVPETGITSSQVKNYITIYPKNLLSKTFKTNMISTTMKNMSSETNVH